jgi:hypothetical protein
MQLIQQSTINIKNNKRRSVLSLKKKNKKMIMILKVDRSDSKLKILTLVSNLKYKVRKWKIMSIENFLKVGIVNNYLSRSLKH